MPVPPTTLPRPRTLVGILLGLLVITWIGVSLSTTTVRLGPAADAPRALSVDEATYYEYVAPRLDRLVVETDAVSALVRDRSRNVVSLSVHGNRIEKLAGDIVTYGTDNGVPERFAAAHERIVGGTTRVTTAMTEARTALQTLDFSTIPNLIPQFDRGATLLHQAQELLAAPAGGTPVAPAGESGQSNRMTTARLQPPRPTRGNAP